MAEKNLSSPVMPFLCLACDVAFALFDMMVAPCRGTTDLVATIPLKLTVGLPH